MATKKQIAANRKNAQKSTGPKTPDGKIAACKNALKHGIFSDCIVLPGEEHELFIALQQSLLEELQPVDPIEHLLVDRIVDATWRLRRAVYCESEYFFEKRFGQSGHDRGLYYAFHCLGSSAAFTKLNRYERRLERSLYKALHELEHRQANRKNKLLPALEMPETSEKGRKK